MSTQSILGSGACGTWNLLPSQFQTLAVLVTAAVRTERPNLATTSRRRDRPTTCLNNSFAKDDGPATRPRRRGDDSGVDRGLERTIAEPPDARAQAPTRRVGSPVTPRYNDGGE